MRPSGRKPEELRAVRITRRYTRHAEGSVLIEFGDTHVLCNASVQDRVPAFLKGSGRGWVTAEYGMLPRSTSERMAREAARGRQGGRTMEIQRLIGRALRAAVDLAQLGERTLVVDCDVIQADGGTRTAAVTGGCVALFDAIAHLEQHRMLTGTPAPRLVASVSAGIYQGEPVLDLDYAEDAAASTDMNFVMEEGGHFVEVQGTAEGGPFTLAQLLAMTELARTGIARLIQYQRESLDLSA